MQRHTTSERAVACSFTLASHVALGTTFDAVMMAMMMMMIMMMMMAMVMVVMMVVMMKKMTMAMMRVIHG